MMSVRPVVVLAVVAVFFMRLPGVVVWGSSASGRPAAEEPSTAGREIWKPGFADDRLGAALSKRPADQAFPPADRNILLVGRKIVVGPQEQIRSLREAARLARDGDTIEILSGEYRHQAVVWPQRKLTIRGIGERRPVVIGDSIDDNAEGKALWVVRDADMSIENIAFRGARVPDGNGAAIRFERGHLRVVGCAFLDNETGILTGGEADSVLEIVDSEFGEAPKHAGALHHLLYVGTIERLTVIGSRFQQGFQGHLIKSRARENEILYNWIVDSAGGRASYELEFPHGGLAWVIGNVIGQSATTDNRDLISYGAEGKHWSDNALYLVHNTLIDGSPGGRFLGFRGDRMPNGTEVWMINNLLIGHARMPLPTPGRHWGNRMAGRRGSSQDSFAPEEISSAVGSVWLGRADSPGSVRGRKLAPQAQFRFPIGTRPLAAARPLSPGAFQ